MCSNIKGKLFYAPFGAFFVYYSKKTTETNVFQQEVDLNQREVEKKSHNFLLMGAIIEKKEMTIMIGETIKRLRQENDLTQKDLAEKLFVTAQAVSRWEKDEVEPSLATIVEMAKIFNVTVSELLGEDNVTPEVKVEKEIVYKEQKPVLAVCHHCNKPIFDGNDIVRNKNYYEGGCSEEVLCKECDTKIKKQKHDVAVQEGLNRRNKSFLWGGFFTGLIMIVGIIVSIMLKCSVGVVVGVGVVGSLFFPFLSCLYLDNNFIFDMVAMVAGWSIRLPRLIFALSLEGIVWLLTVKLLFWILGGIISVCCFVIAVALGLVVGLFVYPFAITKNIKHPEISYI